MNRACENCAWWERLTAKNNLGKCRGAPPTPRGQIGVGEFPATRATDWCGSFRAGEEAIKAEGER